MTREINARISVIEPVGKAIEEVKTILFRPFSMEKWLIIGFCAWLAYLSGSGGGPGGGGGDGHQHNNGLGEAGKVMAQAKDFVISNLVWIVPLACFGIAVVILIGLVLTWLNSRGQFMFLHCVAKNKAEVQIPWTKYGPHGNSLFLFRIVFGLISFVVVVLYILIAGLCIFALAAGSSQGLKIVTIISLIFGIIGFILLIIAIALVKKFTLDFVVPIMFLRTTSCVAAWREFMEILSARKGALALYILFQMVIGIAIGALFLTVALVTCCCACCFLAIPYIGTVLMLPVLVFKRAYSLHYLRQFGSDFDVFSPKMEPNENITAL
jgi:hypothetical protein